MKLIFHSRLFQSLPTYVWEMLVAALWIGSVSYVAAPITLVSILTSLAVLCTFGYVQVATRLSEKDTTSKGGEAALSCLPYLNLYFTGKEILWVCVFALQGAWGALAGVPLFLLYPFWRSYRRTRLIIT
jgi:hypothetical protein